MNNTSNNHEVQELMKELKYLIEDLRNDPLDTSQLELDIMKDKIRAIYDILSDIKIEKVTGQSIESEIINPPVTESMPEVEKEPVLEQEYESDLEPKAIPDLAIEFENDIEAEIENEPETEIKEHVQPQNSEPTLSLFEESIQNLDDVEEKSVGEKIAEEKPIESIGDVIQNKKIVSLKLAIGINEKFFFLNELFDGKMNEYNDDIEELDKKNTFKDAMEYFGLMKENKNWDEESEAYNQLKEFLERKFN